MEWMYTWVFTYSQFIAYVRNEKISIRKRQDYFYNYNYLFKDEIQSNKEDLYYASRMLCE